MTGSKKKIGFTDLRVGILVLLSVGILIVMILTVSGDINFFEKPFFVRTKLSQVDGLRVGTEVRLAGVKVGQVKEVNLLPVAKDDKEVRNVEVVMRIDELIDGIPAQQRIRSDSRVILGSVGLLGDKVIDITPGTLETGKEVVNGGEILGAQETSIKQLVTGASDILSNFTLLSNEVKLIAERINKGEGTAGKFIVDEALYKNLNQTVVEAQSLVKRIREGEGTVGLLLNDPRLYEQIQSTTKNMEKLIADVSAGRGTLGKLATDDEIYTRSTKLLARIDSIADRLEQTATKIEKGEGTVGRLISDDSIYRETEATLANLNKISARLERGEGAAGKLLQDPELYNNANNVSVEVVKLLADFRKEPKKYLTIKIRLF